MNARRPPVALLAITAALIVAAAPHAQEETVQVEPRSFDVPEQGTLRLLVPSSWTVKTASANAGHLDFEVIPGAEGDNLFRITALVGPRVAEMADNPAAVRDSVAQAASKAAAGAEEGSLKMIRFETDSGVGYLFSATDKAPEPGGYRHVWQGSVALEGDLLLAFTILSNQGEPAFLQDVFRLIRQAKYDPPPRATGSGVRLEDGRLIDDDAGYSVSVPPDWRLRGAAAGEWAVIGHAGTGARVVIVATRDPGDQETFWQMTKFTLPFRGGNWRNVRESWTVMGRRRAGEMVSTRTYTDSEPLLSRDLAVAYKSRGYQVELVVPESRADDVAADFAAIVDSFSRQKKKTKK